MITLLVFEHFDEDTSAMYFFTVRETNSLSIFRELLAIQYAFCSLSITVLACRGL